MVSYLNETLDIPPFDPNGYELSLYDMARSYPSASLAMYIRIKFERALLLNQHITIVRLEELFPREDTENEAACIELARWLTMGRHTVKAFCENIKVISPAIVAYFAHIERGKAEPRTTLVSASDPSAIANLKGQEHIKATLEAIIDLISNPNNPSRCRGALLYGPPGTGKTFLAHAICSSFALHFEALRVPDILHAEVGTSEQSLHAAFTRAMEQQPSVIFIDEMEAVFKGRQACSLGSVENRLASQIILEFDRIASARVLVLGVTNLVEHLDSVLFTSGRFDTKIYVGLPAAEARRDILSSLLKADFDEMLDQIVKKTEGYSPAKLSALVDNAKRIRLCMELHDGIADASLIEIIIKDCL